MLDDDRIGNRSVVVSSVKPQSFLLLSRLPQTSHQTEDDGEQTLSAHFTDKIVEPRLVC